MSSFVGIDVIARASCTVCSPWTPTSVATSVWYRAAGLLRRKEIAIEIIEAEIRSAQQEIWREAAKLVLTGDAIEIARRMHGRAERVIKRE